MRFQNRQEAADFLSGIGFDLSAMEREVRESGMYLAVTGPDDEGATWFVELAPADEGEES